MIKKTPKTMKLAGGGFCAPLRFCRHFASEIFYDTHIVILA
jgi:hypothetical protein